MGKTSRPVIVFLILAAVATAVAAAVAAASSRVYETAVRSRDCNFRGRMICIPKFGGVGWGGWGVWGVCGVGVNKRKEITSTATATAVQSPQTGVTSSAVNASTMGKSSRRSLKEDQCADCGDGSFPEASPAEVPDKSPVDPPKPLHAPGPGAP
ncbi:unnamed protein product [Musa acuminata subsp. burmannicoides]